MKKFKENHMSIHITWMSNNSWRKWNAKVLNDCSYREVVRQKFHRVINIQYLRSNIIDPHIVPIQYIRAKSARCAAGWRAIHPAAIPVDVCGKKELLNSACVPQVSATKKRIKTSFLSYHRSAISSRYLSNDEAF